MNNQIARSKRPDHVKFELLSVLTSRETLSFNDLFLKVYENLKERNAVSGGEEMLRLRAYEKLQMLVRKGVVKKDGRQYTGLAGIEEVEV